MKIVLIGGSGFIGTNLAIKLSNENISSINVIDYDESFFNTLKKCNKKNINYIVATFDNNSDFDLQIEGSDIVFHLASTNIPTTSNLCISEEIESNVVVTSKLLDACVRQRVKKVVFLSSGGTVYGKKGICPIAEDMVTYPISSYGLQKLTIEKLLYLYRYQYGLDYRVIRLSNPYGPFQRPNGKLGVITTFIYHALTDKRIEVYGDGSVIRDFIFIDDAIEGIINISKSSTEERVFNLGSGKGTSINDIINAIALNVEKNIKVVYRDSRKTDVPVNYLDISRYENHFGLSNFTSLDSGIKQTAIFLKNNINMY